MALLAYTPRDYSVSSSGKLFDGKKGEIDEEMVVMKSIAIFDLGVKGYDVWNALALALLVCHVRAGVSAAVDAGVEMGQDEVVVKRGDDDL